LIQRKCEKFVDQLISDGRFKIYFLSLVLMHFVICNFDVVWCLCMCVFLLLYF